MRERVDRRAVVGGLAALAGSQWLPRGAGAATDAGAAAAAKAVAGAAPALGAAPAADAAPGAKARTRLILLGTGGGPRPRAATSASALVLSHLVPPDDPAIAESDWIAAARQYFSGPIVVGKDLLEI